VEPRYWRCESIGVDSMKILGGGQAQLIGGSGGTIRQIELVTST